MAALDISKVTFCNKCGTFLEDGKPVCPRCMVRNTPAVYPVWGMSLDGGVYNGNSVVNG